MDAIKLELLLFFNILYVSDCVRRIQGGDQVYSDKSYMVYLVKSPKSDKTYDEWLCGGALVTPWFIITAEACVNDVEYMYAIAGYDTYVPDAEIEINQCTKEKKKKVVYFCVPEGSEIKYDNKSEQPRADIALAKVESAYKLNDISFKILCSYIPTVIPINYEPRFEEPGTDGIVLGWGHTSKWRQCNEYAARRGVGSNEMSNDSVVEIKNRTLFNQTRRSSSSGICQNDHGGPFVTWVGSKEVLIGVSSLFKVSNDAKCIGPYLFTSTHRNAAFIDCVLTQNSVWQPMENRYNRRSILCDSPPNQSGVNVIERYISWSDHPAGAAESEALANVKFVSERLNSKTNATTSISKAFEDLIRLEAFWEQHNLKASN